jgi:hypothetical protein
MKQDEGLQVEVRVTRAEAEERPAPSALAL